MGIIQSYFSNNSKASLIEEVRNSTVTTDENKKVEFITITVNNCDFNSFSLGELILVNRTDNKGKKFTFKKFPFLYMGSSFILKLPLLIVKRIKPPKFLADQKIVIFTSKLNTKIKAHSDIIEIFKQLVKITEGTKWNNALRIVPPYNQSRTIIQDEYQIFFTLNFNNTTPFKVYFFANINISLYLSEMFTKSIKLEVESFELSNIDEVD